MVEMVEFFPWIWREINTQVARKACRDMLIYIYIFVHIHCMSMILLCPPWFFARQGIEFTPVAASSDNLSSRWFWFHVCACVFIFVTTSMYVRRSILACFMFNHDWSLCCTLLAAWTLLIYICISEWFIDSVLVTDKSRVNKPQF